MHGTTTTKKSSNRYSDIIGSVAVEVTEQLK
jgi:hypothetical protein